MVKHSRTTSVRQNTPSLEVDAARFISAHHRFFESKGIQIECSDDFDSLSAACRETKGKTPLNSFFDPALVDTPAHRGLWIAGHNDAGELVHVQAMRCDDLEWTTLGDWWRVHYRRIFDCPMAPQQHPVAENMNGRVVFHGEFWIDRSEARKRLNSALLRFALGISFMRWKPDYLYALTTEKISNAGFPARGGYKHKSEEAVNWGTPHPPWDPSDHMVWSDWQDLVELVSSPPEAYFSGL